MQTKKILAIALAAAMVGSIATVTSMTAFAGREELDSAEELATYFNDHTVGVVGSITGWGAIDDIAMTDEDGDGVYSAMFRANITKDMLADPEAGTIEFKVRADGKWDDSWGDYDEEYERVMNSQVNCKLNVEVGESYVIEVTLDSNVGNDDAPGRFWKVDYTFVEDQKSAIESKLDGSIEDYYFFDNSLTKWDVVGAYWWEPEKPGEWPGIEATQVEGTDYWAVKHVEGTKHIVFNNLVSDDEYSAENPKIQTPDIVVDDEEGSEYGMVYVPDIDTLTGKDGEMKVTGEWSDFAGVPEDLPVVEYTKVEEESSTPEESKPEVSDSSEESKPEVSDSSEDSKPDTSDASEVSTTSDESEVSVVENYETQISDYIFFDNSETKWDAVYAYWWDDSYGRTYDLENNDYGWVEDVDADGNPANHPVAFPGVVMEQVEGTDIWQCRVPFGAKHIIFNSGKSDDQILAGEIGYQTADLDFDAKVNAGQIYTIDTSVEAKAGRGIEKTKYKYNAGAWSDYEGKYNSETLNPKEIVGPVETSDEDSKSGDETSTTSTVSVPEGTTSTPTGTTSTPAGTTSTVAVSQASTRTTTTTGTTTATGTVATGDATMPIAVGAVAAAALGVAVLAKKKKDEE